MLIKNDRLYFSGNKAVEFQKANAHGGAINPKYLIIHYTAGGSGRGTANYFSAKTTKTSAHFVVDRDGFIIQQLLCNVKGHHAGKSAWKGLTGLNSYSIGIEIANWGKLEKGPGGYKSYTGVMIPDDNVILARHKNGGGEEGWEVFPADQFDSVVEAAKAIVEHYGIPEENVLGHDDIAPNRKIDPGPAFNMEQFKAKVYGRAVDGPDMPERWLVRSPSGLNLRDGPSANAQVRKLLPDRTSVSVIERAGKWWYVAEINGAVEDMTGYVHSHWLVRA